MKSTFTLLLPLFFGPFPVDITAGQVTKVEWKCDTGMQ